jgi:hypothetical protein
MIIPNIVTLYVLGFIGAITLLYVGLNWLIDSIDTWIEKEEES